MVLTADERISIDILAAMTLVLSVAGRADPFMWGTAAAAAVLMVAALCTSQSRRELILLGFLMPTSLVVEALANRTIVTLRRNTIDSALMRLDGGWSASFYHWTLGHAFCRIPLNLVYYGLPVFAAFVLIASPRRFACARAWIVAAVFAPIFYLIFPAVGPAHIGDPQAARNCIPSLHLTWALLCAVYMAPRLRPIAIAFAVLTALATLGTGEHYLIDLAAAVPYTVGVYALQEAGWKLHRVTRARELDCETGEGVTDVADVARAARA